MAFVTFEKWWIHTTLLAQRQPNDKLPHLKSSIASFAFEEKEHLHRHDLNVYKDMKLKMV